MASSSSPSTKLGVHPSLHNDTSEEETFDHEGAKVPSGASSLYDDKEIHISKGDIHVSGNVGEQIPIKEYTFCGTLLSRSIRIVPRHADNNPKQNAVFYAEPSAFTPGTPDITMYHGAEKGGPVAGVVRMRFSLGTYNVGLGDPAQSEDRVVWESMKRHGIMKTRRWAFSIEVPSSNNSKIERKKFTWKRTNAGGAMKLTNRKLVDEETGKIVALFLRNNNRSLHKVGELTFYADFGEQWEIMILLTLLGMLEKTKRVTAANGGGGA